MKVNLLIFSILIFFNSTSNEDIENSTEQNSLPNSNIQALNDLKQLQETENQLNFISKTRESPENDNKIISLQNNNNKDHNFSFSISKLNSDAERIQESSNFEGKEIQSVVNGQNVELSDKTDPRTSTDYQEIKTNQQFFEPKHLETLDVTNKQTELSPKVASIVSVERLTLNLSNPILQELSTVENTGINQQPDTLSLSNPILQELTPVALVENETLNRDNTDKKDENLNDMLDAFKPNALLN
jgi:hypothetical protein